jgi:sec-independent protein translocase protein TatA
MRPELISGLDSGPLRINDAPVRGGVVMGGLGLPELLVLMIIALILFGSGRIPALGEGLGKAIRGFKQGMRDSVSETDGSKARSQEKPDVKGIPRSVEKA